MNNKLFWSKGKAWFTLHLYKMFSILLPLAAMGLTACTDTEEEHWKDYQREVVELLTDSQGKVQYMLRDNQQRYATTVKAEGLAPDSVYRMLVIYVPKAENKADIYDVKPVFSFMPQLIVSNQHKDDPIEVLSFWRSPRYLNFRAKVGKSGRIPHYFAYNNRGITLNAAGIRTLYIDLFHDAAGDANNYEDEHFFSCPIYPYAAVLRTGRDSVVLRVREATGLRRFATLY